MLTSCNLHAEPVNTPRRLSQPVSSATSSTTPPVRPLVSHRTLVLTLRLVIAISPPSCALAAVLSSFATLVEILQEIWLSVGRRGQRTTLACASLNYPGETRILSMSMTKSHSLKTKTITRLHSQRYGTDPTPMRQVTRFPTTP